jgi:hypothetical protein
VGPRGEPPVSRRHRVCIAGDKVFARAALPSLKGEPVLRASDSGPAVSRPLRPGKEFGFRNERRRCDTVGVPVLRTGFGSCRPRPLEGVKEFSERFSIDRATLWLLWRGSLDPCISRLRWNAACTGVVLQRSLMTRATDSIFSAKTIVKCPGGGSCSKVEES